jgi:hypothetical protein
VAKGTAVAELFFMQCTSVQHMTTQKLSWKTSAFSRLEWIRCILSHCVNDVTQGSTREQIYLYLSSIWRRQYFFVFQKGIRFLTIPEILDINPMGDATVE